MLGIHYMLCILRVHARDVYTLCTYPQRVGYCGTLSSAPRSYRPYVRMSRDGTTRTGSVVRRYPVVPTHSTCA